MRLGLKNNEETDILRRAFRDTELQKDFDDLQRELAGLEVGRIPRFLSAEERERRKPGGQTRSGDRQLSRLQQLLAANPAYAAAYEAAWNALEDAEARTARALAALARKTEGDGRRLQDILDQAARLPDGTRVFRDEDGTIWTEHGGRVTAEDGETIVWTGSEPGFEDYAVAKEAVAKSETAKQEIETYQVEVLGYARDRLSDEENPPDIDELKELEAQITLEAPQHVQAFGASEPISNADKAAPPALSGPPR